MHSSLAQQRRSFLFILTLGASLGALQGLLWPPHRPWRFLMFAAALAIIIGVHGWFRHGALAGERREALMRALVFAASCGAIGYVVIAWRMAV